MRQVLLTVQTPTGDRDLAVTYDERTTVGQLSDRLAAELTSEGGRSTLERTSRSVERFPRATRLSRCSIRGGDVVRVVRDAGQQVGRPVRSTAVRLTVIAGAGTGTVHELARGAATIGRAPDCEVPVQDELASRRHARLHISDVIEVVDLGSTNGTLVDGEPVVEPRRLRAGDVVEIGDTRLRLDGATAEPERDDTGNDVPFDRSPRMRVPYEPLQLTLPAPPEAPSRQRLPMISALVPLIMGIAMYAVTRSLISVAFIALSPVMVLGSYWESKRSGRLDMQERLAQYRADLELAEAELARDAGEDLADRVRSAPSIDRCVAELATLSTRVWERSPSDADHLQVRIGLATLRGRAEVTVPERGDRTLLAELAEVPERYARVEHAPATVSLPEVGSLGVAGERHAAAGLAVSLVAQAAILHPPTELTIAAILRRGADRWDWLKWLPHVRGSGPLPGGSIASAGSDALDLVARLTRLVEDRLEDLARQRKPDTSVLLIVDDQADIDRSRVALVLERGGEVGVHVLWVAPDLRRLPRACGAVVDVSPSGASLTEVASGHRTEGVTLELLDRRDADEVGRYLAPVVDTAGGAEDGELPRIATLVDLLGGHDAVRPRRIIDRWEEARPGGGLRGVVGATASGVFSLDLRTDGPHGLVAGGTGAGKSEFLRSWLLALAATHPPSRLTYLLVDYKGGAAFSACVELPHTVGLVTDLTPALVERALTSLRAELHRRERLLNESGTTDLVQMERSGHPKTPPSLVIVVDEFAALAQEVPAFVDGVVDVAQRGRSLGLHLVLATQRPAGVITDNIRANTNLRVALRTVTTDDSNDVVDAPDAGLIDHALKGRGVVRLGPKTLLPFQSAWVGGRSMQAEDNPSLEIADLHLGITEPWPDAGPVSPDDPNAATDLEALVTNINEAFERTGASRPRRPWLPPLGTVYELARLPRDGDDRQLVIGVADEPRAQAQRIHALAPEADGSWLLFGSSGAGKTVLLRTLAASAGMSHPDRPWHVHAIDGAGRGLTMIEPLPHVGSVLPAEDYEPVTRLLQDLTEELDDRGRRFAAARASSLSEYRRATGEALPRLLLLVDGFENVAAIYETADRGRWYDALLRLTTDGRTVGLHVALAGSRRSAFPPALTSAVRRRLVLRLANVDEYLAIGVPNELIDERAPAGRLIDGDVTVQAAMLGGDQATAAQAQALRDLGRLLERRGVVRAPEVAVLGEHVSLPDPTGVPGYLAVGADDRVRTFVLPRDEGLVVAGPPRSGKSTAVAAVVAAAGRARIPVVVLAGRRRPLLVPPTVQVAVGPSEVADTVKRLLDGGQLPLVAIDELEDLLDTEADLHLQDLLKRDGAGVVAACDVSVARQSFQTTLQLLRRSRSAFVLQPDPDRDGDLLGSVLPRTRRTFPPGRGLYGRAGELTVAQWADPSG